MSAATPWTRWLQIGLGAMGLPASSFWSLSLREWTLALEGFLELRGISTVAPLTRVELERLIEEDFRGGLIDADVGRSN